MRKVHTCLMLAFLMVCLSCMALAEPPANGLSQTTGLPTDKPYRPILVNISNSEGARPALNLIDADIIYEFIVWGPGHTRYLALYNDQHPQTVGYTRGSRVFDVSIRQAWDCPVVHAGGQTNAGSSIIEYMQANHVASGFSISSIDLSESSGVAYIDTDFFDDIQGRVNPHDNGVFLEKILLEAWPVAEDGTPYEPRLPGLAFSAVPTLGTEKADQITVRYSSPEMQEKGDFYVPMFTYNTDTNRYDRWYNGEKMLNKGTDEQVVVSNVIVLTMPLRYFENEESRTIIEGTGSGPMDAFIGGMRVQGTWERNLPDDPYTYFDSEGNPLILLPGKTFVQVIPESFHLNDTALQDGKYLYALQAMDTASAK